MLMYLRTKRSPRSSSVVSLWVWLGLLISSLHPQPTQSFVSVSRMSTALAYGFAMDLSGGIPKAITSGTDYETDYHKDTQNGQANTDCFVGIGDANGFDRVVYDSPNICLDVAVLNVPTQPRDPELPDAVVTAMAGQEPMIVSVQYGGSDISESMLVDSALLTTRYFPAVMITDAQEGSVYVALHPTHGAFIAPAPADMSDADRQTEEMRSTWFFLEQMTRPAPISVEPPNATDLDHSPKIIKYNLRTKDNEWIHTLDTVDGKSVVTGMALSQVRNKLVLVGSATGSGPGIGANSVSGGDWDGFLTVIDMDEGDLDTKNWTVTWNAPHSTRIRSQKDMDDEVLNVCVAGDKAYVVGGTQGRMEGDTNGGGFVMMYDIDSMAPTWVKQFGELGMITTHCAVQGETLYVGGTVLDNIQQVVSGGHVPMHDIFVAKFDARNGAMSFFKRIDSFRDDELVGMTINPLNSNVIITANARDFKKGTNVVFTMDVDTEGNFDWENLEPNIDPITGETIEVWTVPPIVSDTPDSSGGNSNSTTLPPHENADDWVIATAVTVPAVILLIVTCYYLCNSSRQVPLDYPDDPTRGNLAESTELQLPPTDTGEDRAVV